MGRTPRAGLFSKSRELRMHMKDAADFTVALRAAFPDIRFLADDYTGQKMAMRWPDGPSRTKPTAPLTYRTGLDDPLERRFWVWVEPPGWQPRWEHWANHEGRKIWRVENEPRLKFHFDRSGIGTAFPNRLRDGSIWAYYAKGDAEHLAFLNKVWRMAEKLTTNWLDTMCDDGTVFATGRTPIWVGQHALRWCAASPKRTIDDYLRPPSTPKPDKPRQNPTKPYAP